MENKILRCQDCYNKFIFTTQQQEKYLLNGWQDPIRCPSCRARKKEIYATNMEWSNNTSKKLFSTHKINLFNKIGR